MNSAQRRRNKREFPYSIKLFPGAGWRYFEHDDNVDHAHDWCKEQVKNGYRVITAWNHAEFKFVKEKDAVIFALKWL